jgi:hypothetical protein
VYDVNNGYSYDDTHSWSPQEAISFSNVQGFNIHDNTLSQYGKEGIDVKSGSSSGSIHHNTITTSRASPAFQWSYNHIGIYIDGFSNKNQDISVYSNRITGYGGPGIVIGAESGGSVEDISIYNNVIALSYLAGHTNFRAIDSCYDCQFKNIFIYSNTIYNGDSDNSPIRIFPSAANIINVIIRNNIISGTAYDMIVFQELRSTEVSGRLTLTNNLYYCFGGSAGHNLWKNGADKSWGSNYVLTDPKFVSRSDNNLHLLSSSPAINAGTASTTPTTDFDGVARPQGNGVDIGAYEYVSTTNNPVVFSGMSPANGTTNVPISTSSLSVTMQDPEGNAFSFTIQTRPNVGSKSVSGQYDGVKSCAVSGLAYGTTYRWWVNASDGSSWTRRWYTFTTASNPANSPPIFTSMSPSNGSTNVPISTTGLSLSIKDPEGKSFSFTIQTRPNVGRISVNTVYESTKYCTISGLSYGTTYRWWVNASDGSSWTRRWYTFTTENDDSGNPPAGGGGGGGTDLPPANENETPILPPINTPPNSPSTPIGQISIECRTNSTYTSNAIDPDGDKVRLQIDWGDGNLSDWSAYMDSNSNITFSHAWSTSSNYTIFAIAQDENGTYSTWSTALLINVSEPTASSEPPIIDVKVINDGSVNQTIIFDASNSIDPDGKLTSYQWNYGDGTTGTGATSQHTYTQPGVYEVNLTVTDNTEQTFTKTFQIAIDDLANVPVITIVSTFSYTSSALLIAECIIVIGMMFILRQRNIFKERSKKHREMSIEEKVDMLLYHKTKK